MGRRVARAVGARRGSRWFSPGTTVVRVSGSIVARWSTRLWVKGGLSPPATRWTRLLDAARQLLVEVPRGERGHLAGEAVAAVAFGAFQAGSAEGGLDHGSVLRTAHRRQEGVEGGAQVALGGSAHRRAQSRADRSGDRRPVLRRQERVDQRRLDQDELADQLRVVERQLQRDHAAGGVSEHPGPLDPEAAQQIRALGGMVGHRQRLGGCGVRVPGAGDADPAQAGDGRLALERDEPVGEDCRVDQDERLAVAAGVGVSHGDSPCRSVVGQVA